MPVTIIRRQAVYSLIAEHDLYLDENKEKVLVVQEGEDVPKEAAFVLAGKGTRIPQQYEAMVEAFEAPKPEPEPLPSPILQVTLEDEETDELKPVKPRTRKASGG